MNKTQVKKMSLKELCNTAIDHWVENLFLAHAGLLTKKDVSNKNCVFCLRFFDNNKRCLKCPINKIGYCCNLPCSIWNNINYNIKTSNNILLISDTKKMLRIVEKACDWLIKNESSLVKN